jgi:mycothiol synthase
MNESKIIIRQGWPDDIIAIARFLNKNWDFDTIDADLLNEKLNDDPYADPELCFTALLNGQPVGFLYCVRRTIGGQENGYVKLMAVAAAYRRRKIGTLLYETAEKMLIAKGATHIRWYDVPLNYFMPGLDPRYTEAICFATKQGFKQSGEAINMLVDLTARDWTTSSEEEVLKKKGVEVQRAGSEDIPALKELIQKEWELWDFELDMAMKDDPPSVHIALINGSVKAFSMHNGNNKGTGWFGPMGTHPDARGLGVGSVLLKRCLADMRHQGHQHAVIPWVGPVAFYSHYADARINRVFWRMEKVVLANRHQS